MPRHTLNNEAARHARLTGIDAARGIAIVMVCVSHVRHQFLDWPVVYTALTSITRVATPTFLLLSGFVAAYVLASRRAGARVAVIDRGLAVLFLGHLLLNLGQLTELTFAEWLFGRVTMTDAIGICLIIGALCARLPAQALLAAGVTLAAVCGPLAAILSGHEALAGHSLVTAVLGSANDDRGLHDAALGPCLGVFLIGMGLSKSSIAVIAHPGRLARRLLMVGSAAVGVVVLAGLLWHWLHSAASDLLGSARAATLVRQALNPFAKMPPSPGYLAFYGGAALLVAAACITQRPRVALEPIVRWTSTLGRASLLCFIVQDWLLRLLPLLLGIAEYRNPLFWATYLAAALVALRWLARMWDARGANRYLTVGLKRLRKTEELTPARGSPSPLPVREV
jgi:uncharacterized membrane protein